MDVEKGQGKMGLLVVDAQVGVLRDAWNSGLVIKNMEQVVRMARAAQLQLIWVQHSNEELVENSLDWGIVESLSPSQEEPVVQKKYNSAFEETNLEQVLSEAGISQIILIGAATSWCIRATAYGALERGYDLTVISDAHTTESMTLATGIELTAHGIIEEFNTIMKWVSYPGRKTRVLKTDELSF